MSSPDVNQSQSPIYYRSGTMRLRHCFIVVSVRHCEFSATGYYIMRARECFQLKSFAFNFSFHCLNAKFCSRALQFNLALTSSNNAACIMCAVVRRYCYPRVEITNMPREQFICARTFSNTHALADGNICAAPSFKRAAFACDFVLP
jgi:hypothetical protein